MSVYGVSKKVRCWQEKLRTATNKLNELPPSRQLGPEAVGFGAGETFGSCEVAPN